VTKRERLRRAREAKNHLARFVDIQMPYMEEVYRKEGVDPAKVAMERLFLARAEITHLIQELINDGYWKGMT
jgi:hypothetical protein